MEYWPTASVVAVSMSTPSCASSTVAPNKVLLASVIVPFNSPVITNGTRLTLSKVVVFTGRVTFILNETAVSQDAQELGFPRDLDGDGEATNKDVSGNYTLLPAKVELSWTDLNGPQTRNLYFFLAEEG